MKILKIAQYLLLIIVAALALLLIFSTFPIPGNYLLKVVQSGSMEPAIGVGSVVVVKPQASYQAGDIITFEAAAQKNQLTTHRVVDKQHESGGRISYVTKGDANNAPDQSLVLAQNIVGRVLFTLPYLGYAVDFVKQPLGFFLLIVLPATLVIYDEIRKIKNEVGLMRQKKTLILLVFVFSGLVFLSSTSAFFADTEVSTGNVLQAADSFETDAYADSVIDVQGTFGHCCDANNLSNDLVVAESFVTGAPDSPPALNFIQISDGASITLKFVNNKALPTSDEGPDIRIYVYDAFFPGSAEISVSQNCVDFASLGIYPDTTDVDLNFESTGYSFVKCVRLVDQITDNDPFPLLGFDLDAIEALNSMID